MVGIGRIGGTPRAGHGMWGLTQGRGRLRAEQIVTGKRFTALREVDPLR